MAFLKLKNASAITIHGKRPGQIFPVETDADGIPLELNWRNRLRDERDYALGHIVSAEPVVVAVEPAPEPQTVAPLAPVSRKARSSAASVPAALGIPALDVPAQKD